MKRTDLSTWACPIARSLNRVGEWWSILILRDAMSGLTRFDEFEVSLGIAPNMLTRRLSDLVGAGLLERVQYSSKPPRHEYMLTELGWSFRPILLAFVEWGSEQLSPEGRAIQLIDQASGRPARIGLVDLETGQLITRESHSIVPGPAADQQIRQRFAGRQSAPAGNE
ncbi:transcriptional regulator, HxlR family [Andreprevotia lacus DSM 23236]|jgi:DNA-binding HxlR family transcriptional regulator|uniref:Transcriptional regulator, HxlR family n=1 Tax=Andreprevotia lacus DSM 23236 TaxID=1121001 RepID=A0A1W1X330_9NEIS|nr:helix-turn-helix domain-containing protein [Andreprevotia lacus]SMC18307.1 transcriptional regulator, HxlR family [Andreprevotia lacus DSM 23236]